MGSSRAALAAGPRPKNSPNESAVAKATTTPAGCTTANASFWLHVDTAETTTSTVYDTLKVQVLNSSGTQEDAERLAGELAAKGVPDVGVIDSDDFESLGPDSFVVFSGVYGDEDEADEALAEIRDRAGGGSTRRIVPSK